MSKENEYFNSDNVSSTGPADMRTLSPEEIAAIPGFDLVQDRIRATVEKLTSDFEERIQATADTALDVLGIKFRNDAHRKKFWMQNVGRAVDDFGVNYLILYPGTDNEVLLVRFNPKTLQVQ